MLQLENKSPFATSMLVLPDRHGVDTLYVVVKGTCTLRPHLALAPEQLPIVAADEYFGEPALSSLRQVSDFHTGKPGTDVLLMGRAWAPMGEPATQSTVTLQVAERRKSIHVFGDRVWRNGVPTNPQPFERVALVWERAFGGADELNGSVQVDERNPVGVGFSALRNAVRMEGRSLPNLEDPRALLRAVGDLAEPTGFAPLGPAWSARREFAGTYDEKWQRTRAPYLPDDFDPRFLQSAPAPFAFDRYLQGGEPVSVEGATPDGPIAFAVPRISLAIQVAVAGERRILYANLETLVIEPDANRASLTWRAAMPCDRLLPKVERVTVALAKAHVHSRGREQSRSPQFEVSDVW